MDIKSLIKSASLEELMEVQGFLAEELKSRKTKTSQIRKVVTYTDGASRGNPGPAGIGVLLYNEEEEKIVQEFEFIGETTNNEAEYRALLLALDLASDLTHDELECFMDSELLVRQLNGQYALKSEKLAKFFDEVKNRMKGFSKVSFHHVRREHPKLQQADKLANRAIDEAKPPKTKGVPSA